MHIKNIFEQRRFSSTPINILKSDLVNKQLLSLIAANYYVSSMMCKEIPTLNYRESKVSYMLLPKLGFVRERKIIY